MHFPPITLHESPKSDRKTKKNCVKYTKKNMKKGKPIDIITGSYKGKTAWINDSKVATEYSQPVLIEVIDDEGCINYLAKMIRKTSFMFKREPEVGTTSEGGKKKEPTTTEILLAENPQVVEGMRKAARLVARLGILESNVATSIFQLMVDDYIDMLAKNPARANYFPVKIDEDTYASFFCDSMGSAKRNMLSKRKLFDKNKMSG